MPILAPNQGLTDEQRADLLDVRDRLVKSQSVGATILANTSQAIKKVDAILGDDS